MTLSDGAIFTANKELVKWERLRAQLEDITLDVATIVDTLEGETDLFEALLLISDEIRERDAMEDAISAQIDILTSRKSRVKHGTEGLRAIITMSMDRAGIKTIPGALSTLTVKSISGKLIINDEAMIPSNYWKSQNPTIDKKKLTEALKTEDIRGAQLGNGGISLTIRRK